MAGPAPENNPHVALVSLSKVFYNNGRPLTALLDVDLQVGFGEFVAVIGPSGCGKSTLLRLAGGLLDPTRGQVLIAGRGPQEAQRRKELGFVFQEPALLPWRTLLANVALPLEVNRRAGSCGPAPQELLALVGLEGFAGYYPRQLSGGMQHRAALARALAFGPSLLLMDEPFASLDELTREGLRYELLRLLQGAGKTGYPTKSQISWGPKTVLLVTHSIAEAVLLADRVVVLSPGPGRVVAELAIDLPRPRPPGIEEEGAFQGYVAHLRRLLRGAPGATGLIAGAARVPGGVGDGASVA